MFNLRWSGIAAVAAFIISLLLGIFVRAHILVVLLRAFSFALVFFFLMAVVWRLINHYLPELLHGAPARDSSFMSDFETGSRVNITLGDTEIPRNAAVPPDESSDESVGNIAEMARAGPSVPDDPGPRPSAASPPSSPAPPQPFTAPPPGSVEVPAPVQAMDQSPQSHYTQERGGVSAAPSVPAPGGGFSGASSLGDVSGGVDSLPDLDALAGAFLSPGAAETEEADSKPLPSGAREYRSKKGKDVGEDFNPKELASAIQTILKRD
ncbi:MAG: hypothetical protein LBL70_00085 [Treponema sp.]|nr:hypothetical protein [Treponema sp.]